MPVKQSIGLVALVVRDYDEAVEFYINRLGFTLVQDTRIEAQNNRWVVVAPPESRESRALLARAGGVALPWLVVFAPDARELKVPGGVVTVALESSGSAQ